MPTTFHAFCPDLISEPTFRPGTAACAPRPTIDLVGAELQHPAFDESGFVAHLKRRRLDAAHRHVGRRAGRSLRQIDDARTAPPTPAAACRRGAMPGACLMMSTSGPLSPLVISLSAPLRMTSARSGEPAPRIAAVNPSPIDSTATSTIDDAGDADDGDGRRAEPLGIVRRLSERDGERSASEPAEHVSFPSSARR